MVSLRISPILDWGRKNFTFHGFLLMVIIIGIIMRFLTAIVDTIRFEGAYYSTIGYHIATKHEFVTFGDIYTYSSSLTYPAYLAIFYTAFGFSISVTQVASIIISLAVLFIVYITTSDIMDKEKALIVTAFIAVLQPLITVTGRGSVENMILLFYIPMIWAILKSFNDSRYIILASFFAGLVYYTKTDLGAPIVIGGMIAYGIWRFYQVRWSLLRDKNYYIAFGILLVMVLVRAYMIYTTNDVISTGSGGRLILFTSFEGILKVTIQTFFHLLLLGSFLIFWMPELKRSISEIKKEQGILLLSSIALMIPVILHASGYPLLSKVPIERVSRRYITPIYVPLMWLFLSYNTFEQESIKIARLRVYISEFIYSIFKIRKNLILMIFAFFLAGISIFIDDSLPILFFFGAFALLIMPIKKRLILLLIAFIILSANSLTFQYRPAYVDICEEMNESIEKGDVIALVGIEGSSRLSHDVIYPFIAERDVSFIYCNESDTIEARFIISESNTTFEGFRFMGIYHGNVRPSLIKSIAMFFLGKEDRYEQPPLYFWERI